jgi:hypothetical protein
MWIVRYGLPLNAVRYKKRGALVVLIYLPLEVLPDSLIINTSLSPCPDLSTSL